MRSMTQFTPEDWGPPLWSTLYVWALTANTDERRAAFYTVFDQLSALLPCPECSEHIAVQAKLPRTSPAVDLLAAENAVRLRQGRDPLTIADAWSRTKKGFLEQRKARAASSSPSTEMLSMLVLVLMVGVVLGLGVSFFYSRR